jgi:hypothetical protein
MSFGSRTDGGRGYNDESLAYKRNPTLENYLKIRRENPSAEIEIAVLGGIDPMFALEDEFKRYSPVSARAYRLRPASCAPDLPQQCSG